MVFNLTNSYHQRFIHINARKESVAVKNVRVANRRNERHAFYGFELIKQIQIRRSLRSAVEFGLGPDIIKMLVGVEGLVVMNADTASPTILQDIIAQ